MSAREVGSVRHLLEHPSVVVARGLPICNAAPAVRGQLPWLIYPRHAALGSATPILASPNTANPSTWVRPAARISALRASSALWRRWAPRQLAHSGCTLGGLQSEQSMQSEHAVRTCHQSATFRALQSEHAIKAMHIEHAIRAAIRAPPGVGAAPPLSITRPMRPHACVRGGPLGGRHAAAYLHERVRVGLRMEVARDDIQQLVLVWEGRTHLASGRVTERALSFPRQHPPLQHPPLQHPTHRPPAAHPSAQPHHPPHSSSRARVVALWKDDMNTVSCRLTVACSHDEGK